MLETLELSLRACGVLLDDGGRVVETSPGFGSLIGPTRNVAGRHLADLVAGLHRARFDALRDAVLAGRPGGSIWVPGDAATGAPPLEIRLVRPRNPGDPLVAVLLDRREREAVEEQVLHSDRLRILGEMLAESVHELDNLISVILNACAPGDDASSLDLIRRAAEDALRLTGDLQRFGRSSGSAHDLAVFDVADVVLEAIEFTRARWGPEARREVDLAIETAVEGRCPVRGEAPALRHLFVNLITNAVDAMPAGGRLQLSCEPEGDEIAVRVSDTGTGLDPSVAERPTEAFVSSKGDRGSGLGLSIASTTVARHGGTLVVDSWEGGTGVEVRLPRADAGATGREAPRPLPRAQHVLLVEPRSDVRDLMAAHLERDGHRVTAVEGAREAARCLERPEPPSLIVCSLDLRGGSGLDVVAHLADRELRIPLVLISGWGLELDLGFAPMRDCVRVIHKPVRMSALRRAVMETQAVDAI